MEITILLAFALLLLFPYAISGFVLTGDLRDVILPLEAFFRDELAAGRLPVWDPKVALGYPVLAAAQIGFWYPPLLALRMLPPETALAIATVAHAATLAFGVSRYGRTLGLSTSGALLSALAFTGSGFVVGHLTHANILFQITWLPWALLCTDRLAKSLSPPSPRATGSSANEDGAGAPRSLNGSVRYAPAGVAGHSGAPGMLVELHWRWLGGLSITLALAALAGQLQIAFVLGVLCAVRLLAQLRSRPPRVPWQHTLWTGALLLVPVVLTVGLLTAVQLFPTAELLRESTRGAGGGFDLERANQHSFPPWQAITFLIPGFFGFPDLSEYWGKRPQIEMTAWVGALPLLLAVIGALSRRHPEPEAKDLPHAAGSLVGHPRRPPQEDMTFWILTAFCGFVLALGHWSPLRLLGVEPTLGVFSGPARYLLLTEFSLAILAGFGLDRLPVAARPLGSISPMGLIRPIGPVRLIRRIRVVGVLGLTAALLLVAGFAIVRTAPDRVRDLGMGLVDRFTVGASGHVLPRAAYAEKMDYLVGRLGVWGVNLGSPVIALSFIILAAGSGVLLVRSRRSATNSGSTSPRGAVVAVGFVLATALELAIIAWQVHPRVPWREVFRVSPVVARLRDEPRGRLYVVHPPGDTGLLFANPTTPSRDEHERLLRDLAVANIFTGAGIPGIEWPAALDLAVASRVLDAMRDGLGRPRDENLLDRLGVRYVAGSTATPNLELPPPARVLLQTPSGDGHTITLWERPIVDPAKPWRSGAARPRAELFTETPRDIHAPLPPVAGPARIVAEQPQRVEIAAENASGSNATLVLRDTFYPGWQAALDGAPTTIARADMLFRGVTVPPGKHTVTFTYLPTSARAGIVTSAVAWTLVIGALLTRRAKGA